MIKIITASCSNTSYQELINQYRTRLTKPVWQKMNSFRFETDAHRHLLGNILLLQGIEAMGYKGLTLQHLQYTAYNRPFFNNNLRFNISHSGDYVLCALSDESEIGVDLEEIMVINMEHFSRCFTKYEWTCINSAAQPVQIFYRYWTRKEAVIKADGRGLSIPLLSFEVNNDEVIIDPVTWHLKEIPVARNYIAHIATPYVLNDNYSILSLQ